MRAGSQDAGLPVKVFLQALSSQLDLAQDSLRLKVRAGRPLTWALKDMELELKVFIQLDNQGVMRWRTAGPNESGASSVRLTFTTITRDMVEENTWAVEQEDDPRSLESLRKDLSDQQRMDLNMAGVRTVGQYRRLAREDLAGLQLQTSIPTMNLRAALIRSARPTVQGHEVLSDVDGAPLLRIDGANLQDGDTPEVRLRGEPVEVLDSSPTMLLVRPLSHHHEGQLEVRVGQERATAFFRMPSSLDMQAVKAPVTASVTESVTARDPKVPSPGAEAWDCAADAQHRTHTEAGRPS